MCKKRFQSPCICRKEFSNPRCPTVSVNLAKPRLQNTVRQLGLESSIRHTKGWLKLILYIGLGKCSDVICPSPHLIICVTVLTVT